LTTGLVTIAFTAELELGGIHQLPPAFGWAGSDHLYLNGQLYDFHTPIPVWSYGRPDWASVHGGQVWAVADGTDERGAALQSFTLPQPGLQVRIDAAFRKANVFVLRPGDPVRIDVSGLAAEKHDEIRALLERRARELGYRPAANAAVVLQASEDKTGSTEHRHYGHRNLVGFVTDSMTFTFTKRQAHFRILHGGEVLVEKSGYVFPPDVITYHSGMSTHLSEYGGPQYAIFAETPIPGVIRRDKRTGALASSYLSVAGVRER
jgi:hypothetical protein